MSTRRRSVTPNGSELRDLRAQISSVQSELTKLVTMIEERKRDIPELEAQVTRNGDKIHALEQRVTILEQLDIKKSLEEIRLAISDIGKWRAGTGALMGVGGGSIVALVEIIRQFLAP